MCVCVCVMGWGWGVAEQGGSGQRARRWRRWTILPRMKFLFLGLLTQGSSRMLCAEKPDSKGYIPNDTIYGGMEGRSQLSE